MAIKLVLNAPGGHQRQKALLVELPVALFFLVGVEDVGRSLKSHEVVVEHILANGSTKSQLQVEADLLSLSGIDRDQTEFFMSDEDRLARAYRSRSQKVAYSEEVAPIYSVTPAK